MSPPFREAPAAFPVRPQCLGLLYRLIPARVQPAQSCPPPKQVCSPRSSKGTLVFCKRWFFIAAVACVLTSVSLAQFSFNKVTGPAAGYKILRADADGDGIPDIIGYDSQIRVYLNDGHG